MLNLSERASTIWIMFFLVVLLTSFSLYYYQTQKNQQNQDRLNDLEYIRAVAVHIIDGDTFRLSTGEIVRLICIDAPERGSPGSQEATSFLSALIKDKEILLVSDTDDKDQYSRLLRYVFINNTFVNKELVKSGNAEVWRYGNNVKLCDEIEN